MGALHVLNSRYVTGMEVVAFADADLQRAEKFLEDFGGEYATADASRLFADASLDGVFIIVGEKHHPALGIAAANAGKHIFMEKPIGISVEDAIEVERAVRRNRVKYLIGFCNRLAPAVRKAMDLLPRPWISFGQSTSSIAGQACHHLDLMAHVFHQTPLQSVYASGGHAYNLDPHLPADSFAAVLRFADGTQASLVMHGKAHNASIGKYSLQLLGQDRCVYLADKFKSCHLSTTPAANDLSYVFGGPDFTMPNPQAPQQHYKDIRGPNGYMGHYEELVALRDAIVNDVDPPITVEEGRHALQIEKAILESITTNQLIDFPRFLARWGSAPPRQSLTDLQDLPAQSAQAMLL